MDNKTHINSKSNNELIDLLYELLKHSQLNIKRIIQLFGADVERRLAPDLITIKPTLFQQIKAINIVHKSSPDQAILSIIVIFKNQTLDFDKVAKKFGVYKIYENGREPSYEILFENVEEPFQFVKLYTMPMEYSDNVIELINRSYSWISAVEFTFKQK